jgi:Dolichyl-phosphate-mannose-protein mannosyltransferase
MRERSRLAAMRKCPGLLALLLIFFLVVAFVNPLRQVIIQDDWSYALTVRHLLTTGEYRLNDWAAANMPVQIYWAALLARVFGYSFGVLHCSTVILLLVGLVTLYWLLRYSGIDDIESSLLTLVVLSCPALLFLGFTFQTDVQFLGWQILALWFFSRALTQRSHLLMAFGSIAASAAIGTRQFGVCLVAGLLATWIIFEQQRLRKISLYLIGLVPPLLAAFWQFSSGVSRATFTQKVRLGEQLAYLKDVPRFVGDVLWRPTVILQYVALFLLPLLPLLILLVQKKSVTREGGPAQPATLSRLDIWLSVGWIVYLIAGICFGYFYYLPRILMPYLAWLLPNSQTSPFGFKKHLALTVLTSAFAAVFAWLLSSKYLDSQNWRRIPTAEWFIVLSGMALLGVQLVYAQFYDVYLIQLMPFAVFALGKMAPMWPRWCQATTAGLCLVMLSISACWARGTLAQTEASWRAAEMALSAGARPEDVGGDMHWSSYHGAFDQWMAEVGGPNVTDRYIGSHRMHFAFFDFLNRRFARTKYLVTSSPPDTADPDAQVLGRVEYRDGWLRARTIYLVVRPGSE